MSSAMMMAAANTAAPPPSRRATARLASTGGKIHSSGQAIRMAISAALGDSATRNSACKATSPPSISRDQCM